MYKLIFLLLSLILLNGCSGQTTSILSSGAAIASGGSAAKTLATSGTNLYIEKQTGKNTLEYLTDKTLKDMTRKCRIYHSAELNEIFFRTLDEVDCTFK